MQITKITSAMRTKNWIQHAPRKNWLLTKQYCCNDQQRLDESLSKDWNQNKFNKCLLTIARFMLHEQNS